MRYWTPGETDAELPRLTKVVERARALVTEAAEARRARTGNGQRAVVAGRAEEKVQELVAELNVEGIVLRDVERGLLDFAARTDSGRDYWLCWVVGEPAVAWWHWPEDGFAGRAPLDQPPE